ncbi:MAG: CerR family C-terminal domain-containing protein [Thermodesulfobacteriota bacterium]|nr:CerR family C-terminal domain-containing protein [Thermodesulfobacteriota bacterium]
MTNETDTSTRDKLLKAAIEVFAHKGYASATVREICGLAGTNVAAVNYHFGGKGPLYAAVLEHIFETAGAGVPYEILTFQDPSLPPEERLRTYILSYFHWVFGRKKGKEEYSNLSTIFIMEMARPSEGLDEVVEKYIRPQAVILMDILKDILGPDTPEPVLRACTASVVGQILHYCLVRPISVRLFTNYPDVQDVLEDLAGHVTRFSLGGLKAMKKTLSSSAD